MSRLTCLVLSLGCIVAMATVVQSQEVPLATESSATMQAETIFPAERAGFDSQLVPHRYPRYISSVTSPGSWTHAYQVTQARDFLKECHTHHGASLPTRPFGDSLLSAMNCQINRGVADSLILYHYDFYPRGSKQQAELTSRGRLQLAKMVLRLPAPFPIQIQILEGDAELNHRRRQHVVDALALQGMEAPDDLVIFGRQKHGVRAAEAHVTDENQLEAVKARGRIIKSGESARFGEN